MIAVLYLCYAEHKRRNTAYPAQTDLVRKG